ncbi:hypothetical protein DL89DRAFT_265322 [Linderina pennispora]|uniref:Uncharacterized protein n=1 Tax=Linderina pennispora TaxID=61395 RepID=A0A1Y1WJA8_9FUNG|nr:uncharacterized protein DL89DRAFT_265322 [Linderina pennispora]ORX73184.1 hypothetical protein DL89DRAFT_265322 [Linderina pennispora]
MYIYSDLPLRSARKATDWYRKNYEQPSHLLSTKQACLTTASCISAAGHGNSDTTAAAFKHFRTLCPALYNCCGFGSEMNHSFLS